MNVLLVPAHPGFPGQIPQSRKTVVCVMQHVDFQSEILMTTDLSYSRHNSVGSSLHLVRLAHLQCKSLLFRLLHLSSVCLSRIRSRKLSETGARFCHLYRKLESLSKNMTSDFAPEVAKYPKNSSKPPK